MIYTIELTCRPQQYTEMWPSMYLPILDLLTVHEAMRYIAVRDMTHPVNLFKPVTSEVCRLHNRRPVGELIICKICGQRLPGTRFCTQHLACAGCEAAVASLANSERIERKHAQRLVRMAAMEHRLDLWGCSEGSCITLLHAAAAEMLEEGAYGVLSSKHASRIDLGMLIDTKIPQGDEISIYSLVHISGGPRYSGYDPTHPAVDSPLERHCSERPQRQTAPRASKREVYDCKCPLLTAPTTRNRSRAHTEPSSIEQEVAEALLLLTDLS